MATQILTHLMFDGRAKEAMEFYVSLFPGSKVHEALHYEEPEHKHRLIRASFSLAGQEFICIDTLEKHKFKAAPIMSIFVDCESLDELDRVYTALAQDGEVLMALSNYGFSQKFGWVKDRFGISWQINLP